MLCEILDKPEKWSKGANYGLNGERCLETEIRDLITSTRMRAFGIREYMLY
jgi:hypothetical protein